jgi:hypothetical protein
LVPEKKVENKNFFKEEVYQDVTTNGQFEVKFALKLTHGNAGRLF